MKYRIDEDGRVTVTFAPEEANECTSWLMNVASGVVESLEETMSPHMVQLQHAKDLHFAKLMRAMMTALCHERWHDEVLEREVPVLNLDPAEERELLDELREGAEPR